MCTKIINFIVILMMLHANITFASTTFILGYSCTDGARTCTSSGEREIDSFKVSRDCWEWTYTKLCSYPSKNDCGKYGHCYSLGQIDCLLRDSLGNCVNWKKEFSCKRWTPTYVESETVRSGTKDKEGAEGLVCKGIPCMDGNCIDKSYNMDADMVASVSKLGALSQGKNTSAGFKIFEGSGKHCSKKATEYTNCCKVFPKGWGISLGAKCTRDESLLADLRQKNLCVEVGTQKVKKAGITFATKHHFCCFGNLLEKTIQVQARKQLGMNFGSGGSPNCRGLTLAELERVDFSKMDFSEVAADIQKKIVLPNIDDVKERINDSLKNTVEFDDENPDNPKNRAAGVNTKVMGE